MTRRFRRLVLLPLFFFDVQFVSEAGDGHVHRLESEFHPSVRFLASLAETVPIQSNPVMEWLEEAKCIGLFRNKKVLKVSIRNIGFIASCSHGWYTNVNTHTHSTENKTVHKPSNLRAYTNSIYMYIKIDIICRRNKRLLRKVCTGNCQNRHVE